ncbi:MAG: hypothetical protein OHK0057_34690 [Thermoflexibacter sp.]
MKNLSVFLFIIATSIALWSCNKREALNPDEHNDDRMPTKISSSKVKLTFGKVENDAWIQIDDNERFYHKIDTSRFKDYPDGTVIIQINYPRMFPPITNFETGWLSQAYSVGAVTSRWIQSYESGGLPSYSLFRNLVDSKKLANPYSIKPSNPQLKYKIHFEKVEAYDDNINNYSEIPIAVSFKSWFDRFDVLIIERLDGKPIKIQTSQGYDAKIEYQ